MIILRINSYAAWLAAAILLGIVIGWSLGPLHWPDGATALAADLKLLGWLVVAVLCSSTGAMAWLTFERQLPDAKAGNTHMLESQVPTSQAFEPSSGRRPQPETGVETHAPAVSAANGQAESPALAASESAPAPENPAQQLPPQTAKDPFLEALDYLGHTQATVRVGGILAIERVARSSRTPADMIACAGACDHISGGSG